MNDAMAAKWGQYASYLFVVFQGFLCLHLYLTQVALVARLESMQPKEYDHRGRRDVRSANIDNLLLEPNISTGYLSTETPIYIPSEAPRRKHHRKSHRLPVEKFYVSTESTTTGPVMIRSSRTKLTSASRLKAPNRTPQTEGHIRRVAALHEGPLATSEEFQHLPPAAIHFAADSSNYTRERHSHYAGNGRIKVSGVYSDWRAAPWTHTLGTAQHFQMNQGKVSVSQAGLYLLYAQIHYANVQEVNCFRVMHNNMTAAQCCSTTSHPDRHEVKANTCSLLTTIFFQAKDTLWITDVHERYVILTPEKSYFGLVMLYSPSN